MKITINHVWSLEILQQRMVLFLRDMWLSVRVYEFIFRLEFPKMSPRRYADWTHEIGGNRAYEFIKKI